MTNDEVPTNSGAGREAAGSMQIERAARPGLRWWLLACASVIFGTTLGVFIARETHPSPLTPTSSNVFTSTGGVFTKESGAEAFPWTLPDLAAPNRTVSLSQFRGRPVIVNFWASWCPPCRKEMPALEHVSQLLRGRVAIVGLDTQDERSAGLAFAKEEHVTYPLATDNAQVWSGYGVFGLPTTFFISATGAVMGKQVGGMTESGLESLVLKVFGVSTGKS